MRNQVQPNVHCLVAVHSQNSFIFNTLLQQWVRLSRIILFLEGQIQLFRTQKFLELDAQAASKRPECWDQDDTAIPAIAGDISLCQ